MCIQEAQLFSQVFLGYTEILTGILKSEMRFWLRVSRVQNLLTNVLSHNFVQNIIGWQRKTIFVQQKPLSQQSVEIVRTHDVVFPFMSTSTQEEAQ